MNTVWRMAAILMIGIALNLAVALNHMRWQRNFWQATADWCYHDPMASRCVQAVGGKWNHIIDLSFSEVFSLWWWTT